VIQEANDSLKKEYGIETDINNLIKDGKINKSYIEELSKQLNESDALRDAGDSLALAMDDLDVEKIRDILSDFIEKEASKDKVQQRFIDDYEVETSNEVTRYSGKINIVNFAKVLKEYADSRAGDPKYADAAQKISEISETLGDTISSSGIENFSFQIATEKGVLADCMIGIKAAGQSAEVRLKVTDINNTKLADDKTLADICASGSGSSGSTKDADKPSSDKPSSDKPAADDKPSSDKPADDDKPSGKSDPALAPYAGTWNATEVEIEGDKVKADTVFTSGLALELKDDGTASMNLDGEKSTGTWTLSKKSVTIDLDGQKLSATIDDDSMTINDFIGLGFNITFAKESSSSQRK
jgi:hypothetical protein